MQLTPNFRGPSLILLATVHFVIFVAGLVIASVLRHGAHFVTPFGPAEVLRAFLALSPTAVRVSNFFLFGSAIPFGIFAVTTVSRLRFMGARVAGTNIALLGGLIATIALILSGSVGWILSVPEVLAYAQIVKVVASPALAGRIRNAHGTHRRSFLPQPRCLSGKLLYPHHQVPRLHLDVFSRYSTRQRPQRNAVRLYQRRCIGVPTNTKADDENAIDFRAGSRHQRSQTRPRSHGGHL
jgi:hypothetical protein